MSDVATLLAECGAARLAIVQQHEASARAVGHYDFNNTYQYVINREDAHVAWVRSALVESGGTMPAPPAPGAAGAVPKPGAKVDPGAYRQILLEDARVLAAFVDTWTPRVASLTHARHRTMLNVILGESREHQRLFEQAASGIEDVLGKRTRHAARVGGVLPDRWQE
jgi:hypothetical protein